MSLTNEQVAAHILRDLGIEKTPERAQEILEKLTDLAEEFEQVIALSVNGGAIVIDPGGRGVYTLGGVACTCENCKKERGL